MKILNKKFCCYLMRQMYGVGNATILKWLETEKEGRFIPETLLPHVHPKYHSVVIQQWHHIMNFLPQYEEKYLQESMICIFEQDYPALLKEIYNPPAVLFYVGNKSLLKRPCIAMIGSRTPCEYSYAMLEKLIEPLCKDYVIVSGLARGIDSRSHQRTIYYHGKTIGVLGNGLDICYPKEHYALQKEMSQHHLIISEYPKGTQPKPYYFPERNRIIAGLSYGLCVLQAAKKSGTMITATQALESGREVFAVPGEAIDGKFEGCHQLIQSGAKLITKVDDIKEELTQWSLI